MNDVMSGKTTFSTKLYLFFLALLIIGLLTPLAICSVRVLFPPTQLHSCGQGPLVLGEYLEGYTETMRTYDLQLMIDDEMLVLINCTLNQSHDYWLTYFANNSGELMGDHFIEITNRSSWEGYLHLCCPGILTLHRIIGVKNQMELDFMLVCKQEVIRG